MQLLPSGDGGCPDWQEVFEEIQRRGEAVDGLVSVCGKVLIPKAEIWAA